MKILAVGMNYAEHNKELHETDETPDAPVLFSKADSALLKGGKPFFIPDFTELCEYETELVVRISRLGKCIPERFAHRYYDAVTVGIDFTARDLQKKFRAKGFPWELCKGFDGSAVVGMFVALGERNIQALNFHLDIDGKTVQRGYTGDMLFSVDKVISYASRFFTLRQGDLIYTGTPAGVGKAEIGQHFEGFLEGQKLLSFNVR